MKPRIKRDRGLWKCSLAYNLNWSTVGYGYTPKEAFDRWKIVDLNYVNTRIPR